MLEDLDGLTVLFGLTALAVIYLLVRIQDHLANVIRYIEELRERSNLDERLEGRQKMADDLMSHYRMRIRHRARKIEELKAQARYRRLADNCVQTEFTDSGRECDGWPWNESDERDHAMQLAELRDEIVFCEEAIDNVTRMLRKGHQLPENPAYFEEDSDAIRSRGDLLQDYPLPFTPKRVTAHRCAEEAIEKGRQIRFDTAEKE